MVTQEQDFQTSNMKSADRGILDDLVKSTIKAKASLKKSNDRIHFIMAENYELAFKYNRATNMLDSVKTLLQDTPQSLVGISNNWCQVLHLTQEAPKSQIPVDAPKSPEKHPHIVNPHAVNGHVLHKPTINLTRIPDAALANQSDEVLFEHGGSGNTSLQPSTSSARLENSPNRITGITGNTNGNMEITSEGDEQNHDATVTSSGSKRQSHSTVLSGTFQEVKIYLSPMGKEMFKNVQKRKKPKSGGKVTQRPRKQPKK